MPEQTNAIPESNAAAHSQHRPVVVLMTTVDLTLRCLRGQASYLATDGFDVVLLSSPGLELEEARHRHGIKTIAVPMKRRPAPLNDFCSLCRIIAAFRRLRPTIVSASSPKAGLLGMLAATITRVPVRHYLVRGLPLATASWWQLPALWILERVCCVLAHQVQCVSSSLRDDVVRRGLCSNDKCVVVLKGSSNGVDAVTLFNPESASPGERTALRARLGFPPTAVVVGFVGRLCRDKGIVELAEAWAEVARLCPQAGLLVLGPMEASDAATKDAIDSLDTSPRVRVIRSFLESREYYDAMDILVLPSHREGFPNVCLEAAAMSLPIVTTDATGCRDAVIDRVTGRIIPTGNWNLLARAIRDYIDSPEMRAAHGVAGRNRVLRDYRPIDLWRAQSHLFRQLASTHRNRRPIQHSIRI